MLHKDALILLDSIRNHSYKPNAWESQFINSILAMKPGALLTYKQTRALETIYAKATGGSQFQKRQYI